MDEKTFHYKKFYIPNKQSECAVYLIWAKSDDIPDKIQENLFELQENLKYFLCYAPNLVNL